jgi:hypothetical protein
VFEPGEAADGSTIRIDRRKLVFFHTFAARETCSNFQLIIGWVQRLKSLNSPCLCKTFSLPVTPEVAGSSPVSRAIFHHIFQAVGATPVAAAVSVVMHKPRSFQPIFLGRRYGPRQSRCGKRRPNAIFPLRQAQ